LLPRPPPAAKRLFFDDFEVLKLSMLLHLQNVHAFGQRLEVDLVQLFSLSLLA
jgi:hypothetical protein